MNTNLSEKKLKYFREMLLEMKHETEKLIDTNNSDSPQELTNELSNTSNHPGDLGTEQFEQQRDAGLEQKHRTQLNEIEAALERIDNQTYGISEVSGKPIPEERLEVMPTARYLVEEE